MVFTLWSEYHCLNSLNCSTSFGHKTAMPLLILGPLEGTWRPNPLLFRQKLLTRRRVGDTGGSKESPGCGVIWQNCVRVTTIYSSSPVPVHPVFSTCTA